MRHFFQGGALFLTVITAVSRKGTTLRLFLPTWTVFLHAQRAWHLFHSLNSQLSPRDGGHRRQGIAALQGGSSGGTGDRGGVTLPCRRRSNTSAFSRTIRGSGPTNGVRSPGAYRHRRRVHFKPAVGSQFHTGTDTDGWSRSSHTQSATKNGLRLVATGTTVTEVMQTGTAELKMLHSSVMWDIAHLEREQMLQRAEQRVRQQGYPPPPASRSRFSLVRHEHTGSWAPCDGQRVMAPASDNKVCWYSV
jgi:hypothetical protein